MECYRICRNGIRDHFNLESVIFISEVLLIIANIWMALYHSKLMLSDRKIKHGWWGFAYIVLTAFLAYLSGSILLACVSLFIRKTVFDTALNLFNGRAVFFVSTETTSIIDRIHFKLFGKASAIYMILYIIAIILLNIWIANESYLTDVIQ